MQKASRTGITWQSQTISRISTRQAVIAIVGMGYVGLPLAVAFAEAGFSEVVGVDIDQGVVNWLSSGRSHIPDVDDRRIQDRVENLSFCGKFFPLSQADVVIACVPTPLNKTKSPDLSAVIDCTADIAAHLHHGQLVVVESTTYPGTTDEVVLSMLREARPDLVPGEDYFLAFSPERIDPGQEDYTVETTPKVVGGMTPACLDVAKVLYESIVDQVVPVSSPRTAEMVKLLENTFRAVNIGLVNEMAIMCDRLGIDVWEVIDAAATKPFGFMPFRPGPGIGGHCIPIDPEYLAWKLKTLNYDARFIRVATEINTAMPMHVLDKIADALNDDMKALKGAKVLILGVAYKPNVADLRESPAIDLIKLLQDKGAQVQFYDSYVDRIPALDMDCMPTLIQDDLKAADCVVIVTDHDDFLWKWVLAHSHLVIDTRNATNGYPNENGCRVVKL